jgi:hypothetical protein
MIRKTEPSRSSLLAGTAADGQEGESAPFGERLKLPAGVRHPVNFVVGVWKERDP